MNILREIGIIARALDSIANIEFRDLNLARGQYLYLVRIAEQPGIIQEELSELLKVDRSTVARSVKKLEERGLIQQRPMGENLKTKEWAISLHFRGASLLRKNRLEGVLKKRSCSVRGVSSPSA